MITNIFNSLNFEIIAPKARPAALARAEIQLSNLRCSSTMIPRYLYSEAMLKICSPYLKLKFVFCCLVGVKCTILVLSVFTLSHHVEHQSKTRFSKFCNCSSVSAIITRSSAYNKEFMCTPLRSSVGPYSLKCKAKSLIYKLNSVGDKQSPCRTPQTFSNHSERSDSFSSIHDKVFVRSVL